MKKLFLIIGFSLLLTGCNFDQSQEVEQINTRLDSLEGKVDKVLENIDGKMENGVEDVSMEVDPPSPGPFDSVTIPKETRDYSIKWNGQDVVMTKDGLEKIVIQTPLRSITQYINYTIQRENTLFTAVGLGRDGGTLWVTDLENDLARPLLRYNGSVRVSPDGELIAIRRRSDGTWFFINNNQQPEKSISDYNNLGLYQNELFSQIPNGAERPYENVVQSYGQDELNSPMIIDWRGDDITFFPEEPGQQAGVKLSTRTWAFSE